MGGEEKLLYTMRLKVFIASPKAERLWEIPPDPKMYVKFSK